MNRKPDKKIFRFLSQNNSYIDGYYHFGAINIKNAKTMAKDLEIKTNEDERPSYRIKFDMKNILEIDIITGYIKKLGR